MQISDHTGQPAPDPKATAADADVPPVGRAVRRLRLAKGMSLQQLATQASVSVGMLGQIERNRANPSLRVISQIRAALGVSMGELFEDPPQPLADPPFVRRAALRPWLDVGYVSKELLSPGGPQTLQFMILHIPPYGKSGDRTMLYAAEKGGMVLEGVLLLTVNGQEALLEEGDSFLFDKGLPHSIANPQDRTAKILWIMGAVPVERDL